MTTINHEKYIDLKSVGRRIAKRRNDLNMTAETLAEVSGIGKAANLSKYENGKNCNMSVEVLVRLAEALDCEPDYLLGRIPHPTREESAIGELIPLNEPAIRALSELNDMCIAEEINEQNPAYFAIEASLISELIRTIHSRLLMDNANHKRWTVEDMVKSIWDAEILNHDTDYQTLALRMSISQALGAVVYKCIAEKDDEALAYYNAIGSTSKLIVDQDELEASQKRAEERKRIQEAQAKLSKWDEKVVEDQKENNGR